MNLSKSTASLGGTLLEAYFTTYDGSAGLPLYDMLGNLLIVSGELSPNPAAAGNYRTDYLLSANGVYSATGTASMNFPTTDADGNGVADFLQITQAGSVAFNGTVTQQIPTAAPALAMTGQITRAAGSSVGSSVAYVQDPSAGLVTYRGTSYLLNARGGLSYDRNSNTAVITVEVSNEDGTATTYSGSGAFVVVDANTVSFPAITYSGSNARVIQAKPFTLTRSGRRYLGNTEFQDGGLSTTWRDYIQWRTEITDNNDADADGIPDLSDNVPVAPAITAQPQPATVTVGQAVQFSVTATGTAPLSYQWQRNAQNIPAATAATYFIASAQVANAGDYRVVVSNGAGNAISQVAKLTVNAAAVVPVIAAQPQPATATVGQAVQFSVIATGTAPLNYQWQRNTQNILGATGATYAIASTQLANAGDYRVVVSNGAGNVTSQVAKLTVNAAVSELRIVQLRLLPTAEIEADLSFIATGDYVLEATSDLKSWTTARAFLATLPTMTVRAPNPTATAKFFRVRAVPVVSVGPVIVQQPASQSARVGGTVTFRVTATGQTPLRYQWYRNGVSLFGDTAASLVLSNLKLTTAGVYTVRVTDAGVSVTSEPATLEVTL